MKHNHLADALGEFDDRYIAEAAAVKKKKKIYWLSAVAAILVVAIIWWSAGNPVITAKAISLADYSGNQRADFYEARAHSNQLAAFFADVTSQVLSGSNGENTAFSPMNLYFALAATAELSGGDSQILDLLGADGLENLRAQASCLWKACYREQNNPCLLANSLWLDNDLSYNQSTMDTLAQHYYTSVYQGDFGTQKTDSAISAWLNSQTGGLLKDSADNINLSADTVFALYATIFFQCKWQNEFYASQNTKDVFHASSGDITCTYMNKQRIQGNYMWGENFGAITLGLKDGSRMWLILPDEGKTIDEVLSNPELGATVFGATYEEELKNHKYMFINLSLPKFDIRSTGDLKGDLQKLGVTDVFDPHDADFSAIYRGEGNVWLTAVNQATRVAIDEEGITAASYIEIPGAGNAAPPEEIIDFILDRPFIFVVTNHYNLPLFAGVVNQP